MRKNTAQGEVSFKHHVTYISPKLSARYEAVKVSLLARMRVDGLKAI